MIITFTYINVFISFRMVAGTPRVWTNTSHMHSWHRPITCTHELFQYILDAKSNENILISERMRVVRVLGVEPIFGCAVFFSLHSLSIRIHLLLLLLCGCHHCLLHVIPFNLLLFLLRRSHSRFASFSWHWSSVHTLLSIARWFCGCFCIALVRKRGNI